MNSVSFDIHVMSKDHPRPAPNSNIGSETTEAIIQHAETWKREKKQMCTWYMQKRAGLTFWLKNS